MFVSVTNTFHIRNIFKMVIRDKHEELCLAMFIVMLLMIILGENDTSRINFLDIPIIFIHKMKQRVLHKENG